MNFNTVVIGANFDGGQKPEAMETRSVFGFSDAGNGVVVGDRDSRQAEPCGALDDPGG